eukprot:1159325-Pelagomonas_calceolata.AAC.4
MTKASGAGAPFQQWQRWGPSRAWMRTSISAAYARYDSKRGHHLSNSHDWGLRAEHGWMRSSVTAAAHVRRNSDKGAFQNGSNSRGKQSAYLVSISVPRSRNANKAGTELGKA